jgi:cytochrome oxidase Cu insertion factor (SCO1/SenC/PrrC family)
VTLSQTLRSRLLVYGLACLVLIAAVAALAWSLVSVERAAQGSGKALIGGPFTLTDQHGQEVTEQDFAGRYMLIYFGYTFCPDFCPLSLSTMSRALELVPPEVAEQVVPIFISVDPRRDTVEHLAEYAPSFHPRLVALTGTEEQVEAAAGAYRVYFKPVESENATDYLVDHSTFIYLMGPDGGYVSHFGHDASAEEMAERLEAEVAGS